MFVMPELSESQAAAAVVQQLLATHRVYAPLDWLLEANHLGYDDYRDWRRGRTDTLDAAFAPGPGKTRELVAEANGCARKLRATAERVVLYGIEENAGAELRASADQRLDDLLRTEFRLAADRRQGDIFVDAPANAAFNDLHDSLASRDGVAASKRLQVLARADVHHWAIADAAKLIEALSLPPPQGDAQGLERLEMMESRWLLAASAVLHAGARDFLTPLWRDIGRALENTPFDAERPRRHAAWAYLQGLDWRNAKRLLLGIPTHREEPFLLGWRAEAEWRLRNRKAALECWFELCWRAPEHFRELIANPRFPDRALLAGWQEAKASGIEPPLTPEWFPAWMVVVERHHCRSLEPQDGDDGPRRAFDLMRRVVLGGTDRQDIENRRALQALHPGLLQHYLDSLDP